MRTPPAFPSHWRPDLSAHRLTLGSRLDGLELVLDLPEDGHPVFLVIFPTGPTPSSLVLEDATDVAGAVAQIDKRWPGSPWMTDLPGDADLGPGVGQRILLPLLYSNDPTATLVWPEGLTEEKTIRLSLESGPIPYAAFNIVGLRVRLNGVCVGQVTSFGLTGDINLLLGPQGLIGLGGEEEAPEGIDIGQSEITGLRAYPVLRPGDIVHASFSFRAPPGIEATVAAEVITQVIYDPGARLEGIGSPGHAPEKRDY